MNTYDRTQAMLDARDAALNIRATTGKVSLEAEKALFKAWCDLKEHTSAPVYRAIRLALDIAKAGEPEPKPETAVSITVTDQTLADILCIGCEGGIQYWAEFKSYTTNAKGVINYEGLVAGGCEWTIKDCEEGKTYTLNREALQRGLQALSVDESEEFFRALDPMKADASTGDALIQCALFGRTIYG